MWLLPLPSEIRNYRCYLPDHSHPNDALQLDKEDPPYSHGENLGYFRSDDGLRQALLLRKAVPVAAAKIEAVGQARTAWHAASPGRPSVGLDLLIGLAKMRDNMHYQG